MVQLEITFAVHDYAQAARQVAHVASGMGPGSVLTTAQS